MKSSRLFYVSMMLFWIVYLSLLAMVVSYSPQGGVDVAGLALFTHSGLIDATLAAMNVLGLSGTAQSVVFGILGGLNLGAAGLVVFATMFFAFGEEPEQRDARPMAECAAGCVAAASALTVAIGFAGGQAGALMLLELTAFGGLVLIVFAIGSDSLVEARNPQEQMSQLDDVIADHAATHAAFSAQLATMSRRELET
jgi:hypothetical protein